MMVYDNEMSRSPSKLPAVLFLLGRSLALVVFVGCVSVKPVVLDRKTQLENQILGTFKRLQEELILASSVRGEGQAGKKLSPLEREAVEAMMTREFNRDDIEDLKTRQVVGEGNDGLLATRDMPSEAVAAARVKRLVQEENSARLVLMKRVIQQSPDLSDKDLPELRRIFHRLNVQTARKGDWVQRSDGKWEQTAK